MKKIHFSHHLLTFIGLAVLSSSCASFENQRANYNKKRALFYFDSNNESSQEDEIDLSKAPKKQSPQKQSALPSQRNNGLELQQVDDNTWRTKTPPHIVYGLVARLLSQSYMISQADRKNLTLQTDWDKFFIDGKLFRNKLSLMVFPISPRQTEIVLKNTVEYFVGPTGIQDQNPQNHANSTWIPSPDITDEVQKFVEAVNKQTAILDLNKNPNKQRY